MAPPPEVSSRVFTLANVISVVRLMSIPLFLYWVTQDRLLAAFVLLVVAVLTDFVDGMIARAMNEITKLGQFLDPFADRLFIAAIVVALAIQDVVPWWFVVAVMLRDALLGVGGLVMSRYGAGTLPVKWWGKVATFGMLVVLPLFFLGAVFEPVGLYTNSLAWILAIAVVVLYWVVGFSYLADALAITRSSVREEARRSGSLKSSSKESDERNTNRV
jgi:cardiolipin synthase